MTLRVALICAVVGALAGCGQVGSGPVAGNQGGAAADSSVKPWGTQPVGSTIVKPDVATDTTDALPNDAAKPGAAAPPKDPPVEASKPDSNLFQWAMSREDGVAKAKKEHGYVVLKFEAEWCGPCQVMKHEAFQSPDVAIALKRGVIVPVDFDSETGQKLAMEYGTTSLPRMVFLHTDGKAFGVIDGYSSVDWLVRQIDRVLAGEKSQG